MISKIDFTKWQDWSWKSEDRYYHLLLKQNLFGQWCLIKKWGGLQTRKHGSKTYYLQTLDEAILQIDQIHKRRISRGYDLVN